MPAFSISNLASLAILLAMAAFTVDNVLNGRKRHARFKGLETTAERQLAFKRRIYKSFLKYGIFSLLGLILLGRINAIWQFPPEYAAFRFRLFPHFLGLPSGDTQILIQIFCLEIMMGIVIGSVLLPVITFLKKSRKALILGDVQSLLPRNIQEMKWGALVSANAGVSEELYFRLLMPLAIYNLSGNLLLAFAVSSLVFGIVHAYQGLIGVAATLIAGLLFCGVFILSGNLLFAMALHALIDLRALVISPAITWKLNEMSARRSPKTK